MHTPTDTYSNAFDLQQFDTFLANRVKERNRKSVLRVARNLVHGKGIKHKNKPGEVWLAGYQVTLADDLELLQEKANQWLPWRKSDPNCLDGGHGWAVNHPLMWMGRYKTHLLGGEAKPTSRKRKRTVDPLRPTGLTDACCDLEKELEQIPALTDANVRRVYTQAAEFIAKKEADGDDSATAPVIFLGNIPELANVPHEMTTAQVRAYIKDKFKTMDAVEFNRGWYGVDAYFKLHPKGEGFGYVPKLGWLSVDHVLAQYFGILHHPRFYALMSPSVNAHLKYSSPITRLGFGLSRHDLVKIHTWMKHIEIKARSTSVQTRLIGHLVTEMPVQTVA